MNCSVRPWMAVCKLNLILITIDVQTKPFASFQHEGIELIYVIEGGVIYRHGFGQL